VSGTPGTPCDGTDLQNTSVERWAQLVELGGRHKTLARESVPRCARIARCRT